MKIALIQTRSVKGDIEKNISNHLKHIKKARGFGSDLIVFPELSLTNYEPSLAADLAMEAHDQRLFPFQEIANASRLTIGIGMPLLANDGITISMVFFRPGQQTLIYSKRILHEDEKPYFVPGKTEPHLKLHEKKITLGICYETLQQSHFDRAVKNQSDLFIASVSKPERSLSSAYINFSRQSAVCKMPILMVNSIGTCEDFISNGKSAIWSQEGRRIAELDDKREGILVYDTKTRSLGQV